jgi:two-component system KDP operon response regulator KdpE
MIPERPTHILVVDDEEQIRRALRSILRTRNYLVSFAETGQEALVKAREKPPDMVILDLALPDISGLEVCHDLRSWSSVPILVLSVHSAEADKIAALDMGADDFLAKPFLAGELLARVRALLRRATAAVVSSPAIRFGDLTVDIARRVVTVHDQHVHLTPTEFDILALLAGNAGAVLTQGMILERVWGPEWVEDAQLLRVHMNNLRRKIGQVPGGARYIITEPGIGFRFSEPDEKGA